VRTATSFARTTGYQPDYSALTMDAEVVFPWDRQVFEDDELVVNPRYRERSGARDPRKPRPPEVDGAFDLLGADAFYWIEVVHAHAEARCCLGRQQVECRVDAEPAGQRHADAAGGAEVGGLAEVTERERLMLSRGITHGVTVAVGPSMPLRATPIGKCIELSVSPPGRYRSSRRPP
jgi:hypothetical protein